MHNITASGNISEHGVPNNNVPVTDSREGSWSQPVLTVTEGRTRPGSMKPREVSFLFRGGITPGVVVNPWDVESYVPIVGEDLFALRELLNELPEEAFRRPTDPVPPSRWWDGDQVLEVRPENRCQWLWTRKDGGWYHEDRNPDYPMTDEKMDDYVDGKPSDLFIVLRERGEAVVGNRLGPL